MGAQIQTNQAYLEQQIESFKRVLADEISRTRLEHSVRVANLSLELAICHGYNQPLRAYLAGILHDITKQKGKEFHRQIFQEFHGIEWQNLPEPAYHAFSAPLYLQKQHQFIDRDIFSAIQSHTLGTEKPILLDQILYCADFLGSEYAARQKEYDHWLQKTRQNLHYGCFLKAKHTIQKLIKNNQTIHPFTCRTYNDSVKNL